MSIERLREYRLEPGQPWRRPKRAVVSVYELASEPGHWMIALSCGHVVWRWATIKPKRPQYVCFCCKVAA